MLNRLEISNYLVKCLCTQSQLGLRPRSPNVGQACVLPRFFPGCVLLKGFYCISSACSLTPPSTGSRGPRLLLLTKPYKQVSQKKNLNVWPNGKVLKLLLLLNGERKRPFIIVFCSKLLGISSINYRLFYSWRCLTLNSTIKTVQRIDCVLTQLYWTPSWN